MTAKPDSVFQPFQEYSLVNRSATEFSAFVVRFTTSSTSFLVMLKGGAKPRMSPFGIARAIRFCSRQAAETLAPTFQLESKLCFFDLFATNSNAASRPTPRTSPTSGWFSNDFLNCSCRYEPVSRAFSVNFYRSRISRFASAAAAAKGCPE